MKEKLRKEIKEKRSKITKEEQRKKSKEIKKRLFELKEFKEAKTVLFYVSYNGEVFTHDMIKETLNKKRVVVPISNKDDHSLTLSEINSFSDLEESSYGILEPKEDKKKKVNINYVELIIVPGVAFDSKGNRIGHGMGYYDKLLNKIRTTSIGLCFEFQLFEKISIKSNDKPVDIIITEKRIINCKKA